MIEIKTEREIRLMEEAGRIVRAVLSGLRKMVVPGVTTAELDRKAEEMIRAHGAVPAFKGYRGFPANICTSINEQIVHGIPGSVRLRKGDILSIDVGVEKDGYYGDAAITVEVGDMVAAKARQLIRVTKEALRIGIEKAKEGNRLFDISNAIQIHVETCGYSVVRDFVGHGIGKEMHEEPEIPNFGRAETGPRLRKGMTLAIEPMVNEGRYDIEILDNRWTAVTKDGKLSAHFEHTICVTEGDPRILT